MPWERLISYLSKESSVKNKWLFLLILFFLFPAGCDQNRKLQSFKFSGTLELTEHSLGAKVAGRLASLGVDEGDEVKKGDLVATLDRFEQTRKDYERLVRLLPDGGANQQEVEYAALAMEDQRVVSPLDGVVLAKVHEAGEIVAAGSPVVVIGDRKSLWVRIYVPEGLINKIQLNQPAALHFDGLEQSFPGHVSFIAAQAEFTPRNVQTPEERVTQTFAVKVTLDHPPAFLRPGVAADVVIEMKGF